MDDPEWISPIDGHRHFCDAGRAECAVCCLEAERDRLRAANTILQERDQNWERYCTNQALIDAGKVVWLEACVRELEAQLDRLRAVVEAAEQFVHDRARWHLELERDDAGPGEQFRQAYDNALGVLVDVVFALDVSPTGEGT